MFAHVVEQHVDVTVFLYALREAAAVSPQHDARTLGEIDGRLEAHLDGLRIAGSQAAAMLIDRAEEGDVGGLFAAAQRALEAREPKAFAKVLDVAHDPAALPGGARDRARAIVAAIRWTSIEKARWALSALLAPTAPAALHALGVAGLASHGEHPGAALQNALYASDPGLKRAALDAIGTLGARELMPGVRANLAGDVAFEAARASVLLGDPAGLEVLFHLADAGGADAPAAISLAARAAGAGVAAPRLDRLLADGRDRAAIVGAEALGDPRRVPSLVSAMRDPKLARLAGRAFETITAIAITGPLALPAPVDDEDDGPDAGLPVPDPEAVARAWDARRKATPPEPNARWLLGAPPTQDHCARIFASGRQPHRLAAAIELTLQSPGRPLADARAPLHR